MPTKFISLVPWISAALRKKISLQWTAVNNGNSQLAKVQRISVLGEVRQKIGHLYYSIPSAQNSGTLIEEEAEIFRTQSSEKIETKQCLLNMIGLLMT